MDWDNNADGGIPPIRSDVEKEVKKCRCKPANVATDDFQIMQSEREDTNNHLEGNVNFMHSPNIHSYY